MSPRYFLISVVVECLVNTLCLKIAAFTCDVAALQLRRHSHCSAVATSPTLKIAFVIAEVSYSAKLNALKNNLGRPMFRPNNVGIIQEDYLPYLFSSDIGQNKELFLANTLSILLTNINRCNKLRCINDNPGRSILKSRRRER